MGRQIPVPWDDVPDSTLLPENLYMMSVNDITEEQSKKGHLMYKAEFRVTEPKEFKGTPLFDYFVIGNDDDPQAAEAATWTASIGVRRLKRLAKATMVGMVPDIGELVESMKDQRFVASISQETDDGTRDPKYAGVKRNRINAFYPISHPLPGGSASLPQSSPSSSSQTAKPPAASTAKTAPKAATVACPFCSESIGRSDYANHVRDKHPDE